MFDFDSMTLKEVSTVEELSGQSIASVLDGDTPKGKALAALAFVAKRRDDKAFTFNKALDLTFSEANAIIGFGEEVDEVEGEDESSEESETE